MPLNVESVPQWVYIRIPIRLMSWYTKTQACDDGAVVTFSLPICQRAISCRDDFLNSAENTNGCNEFAQELESIIGQYLQRYPIWQGPIVQE